MELKISGNRRLGGPMNAGEAYIVGETSGAKELVIPKTDSMVLNENKTDAIINNALDKSSGKTTSAPLVIASTNTNAPVNHNSTNVASNTFVEPDPIFRRNTQFAI